MAIDANALTLVDYAQMRNDPLVTKIVMSLFDVGNLVDDIPLMTSETLVQMGVRFVDNLPVPTWRQLNQLPTITKGVPTPWQEQLYIVSSQFQMEKRFLREKNAIQDPMEVQFNAWMEAWAYTWNNIFFNNAHDGTGDANAPVGIKARITNPTQYGVASDMAVNGINGATIDLSTVTASSANDLIDGVNQLLINMNAPDGNGVVLYMNEKLNIRFLRAIRSLGAGGGFNMEKDAFGRQIEYYRQAKIRRAGRLVDQVSQVLGDENSDGTAYANGNSSYPGRYASIFGVRYGKETFAGWQDCELKPQNLGIDPTNGVMVNALVDWGVGLWQSHTRALGRLYNIKISAS